MNAGKGNVVQKQTPMVQIGKVTDRTQGNNFWNVKLNFNTRIVEIFQHLLTIQNEIAVSMYMYR
jgi:hypothetical protein